MKLILPLLIILLLLSYVLWHVWTLVPLPHWGKWVLAALGIACFAVEIIGFTGLLDQLPLGIASFCYNLGNKALIIIFYLMMAFLLLDMGRLLHIVPKELLHDNWGTSITLTLLMAGIFLYGGIHYHHKVRGALALDSGGRMEKPLKLVMASDLHIGYGNRRTDLAKWVDLINAEQPDMVLIAGDIVDFSMRPVLEEEMADEFRRIKAPIYACLGNHEYYAGISDAEAFYSRAGIQLLEDSLVHTHGIALVGRIDRTSKRRKPLSAYPSPDTEYTIVMDHQPYPLEEAEQAGVDFQLSGHTHQGQIWPLSWIVNALYECAWGSHQRGKTHYYVSSGLGVWGAKYRIGTQSEYVVATIR